MPKSKKQILSEWERGYKRGFDEGFREGSLEGYEFYATLSFLVLYDKFGYTDEQMKEYGKFLDRYVDMVKTEKGRFNAMRKALKDEYNMVFRWVKLKK